MQIKGKIIFIDETKTYGNKGFKKRELAVETKEEYPQKILVEFIQDKTEMLDRYKVGQDVSIGINLNGREWVNPEGETKYFNSIRGWRIGLLEQEPATQEPPQVEPEEDLPF